MIKDKNYYLSLDYDIIISAIDEINGGGFFAYYQDIPLIMGDGETRAEAIKDVKSAFENYVGVALSHKDKIPEPQKAQRTKKINISLTSYRLNNLDNYAQNKGLTRSGVIARFIDKLNTGEIRV